MYCPMTIEPARHVSLSSLTRPLFSSTAQQRLSVLRVMPLSSPAY